MTEPDQTPAPAAGASEVEATPEADRRDATTGSGASEVEAQPKPRRPMTEEQRLEEGLEETFPASDPVSAKHID